MSGIYQCQSTNAVRSTLGELSVIQTLLNGSVLPTAESARDLGVSITQSLSPSLHVSNIVAKANQRAAAIYRAFTSRDITLLLRAYTTYVRPIVEHDSVVGSPYTVKDIDAVESVQCLFTKRLPASTWL